MIAHVKPRSLVSTLFIRVAVLLGATIVAIGATAFWAAKHRIDEVYDSQLISGTKTLYALTKQELEDYESGVSDPDEATSTGPGQILDVEDRQAFETYQGWRMFRIWHAGRLVASSKNGPTHGGPPETTGFVDLAGAAGQWRTYRFLSKDNGLSIAVGEPLTVRYALIENIALTLVVPLVLLIPASAALIWLMLLDGLGALRRLATALETKSGSNLVPLSASQWPRDLGGVLTAINDLLGRLDRSFRQTLRFTDHAAHQLRTPLAGLKLNAQMIEAEKDPEEQRAIILRIREGAERAAALVEQLLTLARLDSGAFASSPHDVTAVAKSALGQLAPAAASKNVTFALTAESIVMVQADALLLEMIVINLVDNAIKHSPPGGEVAVEIVRETGPSTPAIVRLAVRDHGPGIPPEERQHVFERFYKGNSGKGVGLGLSIVAEALARIDGSISLECPEQGHGLRAVVRLRAA